MFIAITFSELRVYSVARNWSNKIEKKLPKKQKTCGKSEKKSSARFVAFHAVQQLSSGALKRLFSASFNNRTLPSGQRLASLQRLRSQEYWEPFWAARKDDAGEEQAKSVEAKQ